MTVTGAYLDREQIHNCERCMHAREPGFWERRRSLEMVFCPRGTHTSKTTENLKLGRQKETQSIKTHGN